MVRLLLFLVLPIALSYVNGQDGDCTVYDAGSGNCGNNCGACFNPGSRSGVMCKAANNGGYYCPADSPEDMAYACMDWTSGSKSMQAAEAAYLIRTGQSVYLGVGTYGTGNDVQQGLGQCLMIEVDDIDRPLLVQSVNTGSDVAGDQFDLQIGDGGCGAFNTCAGGSGESMFPGSYSPWGKQYGGVDYRSECAGLPPYPKIDGPMKEAGDSLIELCEISFDRGYRYEGGMNPTIQSVTRVECPDELVAFTQMKRTDDPPFDKPMLLKVNNGHTCGGGGSWCLTRMMDCRKPSGGWPDNVRNEVMMEGMKLTQPCTVDGYTRIDVQCGCYDCYC